MKYLLTYIFTFISFGLSAQAERNQTAVDTVDVTYSIYELFSDIRLENETVELKIVFDSITESNFNTYKEKYRRKSDTISKLISRTENCFSIRASDTIFEFPSIMGRSHYYGGFYPQINAQLVKVAGAGICEMFLIDQKTAIGLSLPAFYDGSCNQPLISENNRFLMTYGTCPDGKLCYDWYEQISTISIVNISKSNSISNLNTYRYIAINDFTIEEIFWVENDYIVLKVFDEIAFDDKGQDYKKNIRYLRGKVEW